MTKRTTKILLLNALSLLFILTVFACAETGTNVDRATLTVTSDDYYEIEVEPGGFLVSEGTDAQFSYDKDTTVTLTLTRTQTAISFGLVFTGWTGDLSGTNNPESLVLDSDKSVSANLGPIDAQ